MYVTTIAWCKYALLHSISLGNNSSVEVENVKCVMCHFQIMCRQVLIYWKISQLRRFAGIILPTKDIVVLFCHHSAKRNSAIPSEIFTKCFQMSSHLKVFQSCEDVQYANCVTHLATTDYFYA